MVDILRRPNARRSFDQGVRGCGDPLDRFWMSLGIAPE